MRIEDYAETLRDHRVLHLVGKGDKPATMPLTVPALRVLEACRGQRTEGPPSHDRCREGRSTAATVTGGSPESRTPPASHATSAHTRCATRRSPTPLTPAYRCATRRSSLGTPTPGPPSTTTARPGQTRRPRAPLPDRLRGRRVSKHATRRRCGEGLRVLCAQFDAHGVSPHAGLTRTDLPRQRGRRRVPLAPENPVGTDPAIPRLPSSGTSAPVMNSIAAPGLCPSPTNACQTRHVKTKNARGDAPAGVFFAYPGAPALTAECMRRTAEGMRQRGVAATVWEELPIEGRLMIQQVLDAIDSSDTLIAEASAMNPNVLFELGFGIARDKHTWAVIDETDTSAVQHWRDFGLLTGVGRVDYSGNSQTLLHKFSQARPDLAGSDTLWSDLYAKIRSTRSGATLFHYATAARDDGARAVQSELSRRRRLDVIQADEDERGAAPLEWYVDQIHRSSAVLIHLMSPGKERARTHNARASFLAGISHGLERPLLMLAPPDFIVPLDYRDLLHSYETIRNLGNQLSRWLG